MKYTLVVNFKTGISQPFTVDTYAHANGVLELFNCNGNITTITVFPLGELSSIIITQTQIGA